MLAKSWTSKFDCLLFITPMATAIVVFLIIFTTDFVKRIECFPIENGFTVRFNPIAPLEDLKYKKFGNLFAKIPQDFAPHSEIRRKILTQAILPQGGDNLMGHTNQIAKILFPFRGEKRETNWVINDDAWNLVNLPLVKQPYENYKILVAVAPPEMAFNKVNNKDYKNTIVYVVFPDDNSDSYNIPAIYFVNEKHGLKSYKVNDPILMVDHNRTVTSLRSKEISKSVKFRSKFNERFSYELTP